MIQRLHKNKAGSAVSSEIITRLNWGSDMSSEIITRLNWGCNSEKYSLCWNLQANQASHLE